MRTLKIMPRDLNLLQGLGSFYLLSTKQIKLLYFQSVNIKTALRRLRLLTAHGYLRRFRSGVNGECIWSLGKASEELLAKDIKIQGINRNSLVHDLKANDLRIKLESKKLGSNFISGFYLRHKASADKSPYTRESQTIPDWIFTLRTRTGFKVVALECELNYKGKKRMNSVFERYYHKESIHNLWYVVPTQAFKSKILKLFKDFYNKKSESYLWVSTISEFEKSLEEMSFSTLQGEVLIKKIGHFPAHPSDDGVSRAKNVANL